MAEYFDRSNAVGDGTYYDRTNAVLNSGDMSLSAVTLAGSGIVYQNITGVSIVTDQTSIGYNAPFAAVDGDIVAVPATWLGSTITVYANWQFVITPALPNGTNIPRRMYDASAGLWYDDTVTILDGAGTGSLELQTFGVTGSGTVSSAITGTGDLSLTGPTVAGAGSLVTTGTGALSLSAVTVAGSGAGIVTGSGALNLSALTASGAGVLIVPGSGTATLTGPTVSGSGSVIVSGTGALALENITALGAGAGIIVGSGALLLDQITAAGTGTAAQGNVTGTGDLQLISPSVAATGLTIINGSGALTLQTVEAQGSGSAQGIAGTGAVILPFVGVSGTGTVESQGLPVIVDGGNLAVQIPAFAAATETDNPVIAAWLASFTASDDDGPLPVTNDAPFYLDAADSPITVTFSATNISGTTTRTATLTITVAAESGQLVPSVTSMRIMLPTFADPVTYPYATIAQSLDSALCYVSDRNCGRLTGECRLEAIYLMAGHLLYMLAQAAKGKGAQVVTGATIDAITIQLQAPPANSQWQWWLNGSPYGQQLQALLSARATGGFFIGGSPERYGFRKWRGRF